MAVRSPAVVNVLVTGQRGPRDLAVDATQVYWVNHTDGTVMSVARQGGQPNVLATGQDKPWRVSVDDLYVYWVGESMKGSVMRVPKHGGEPAVVASASAPATVEARGGDVYWLTGDGSLFRCAARGGSIATLAQTQTNPSLMALDRDAVYWTN